MWRKNLQNAERDLAAVDGERDRRMAQLVGRETVTTQTETLTASWVEIVPDGEADAWPARSFLDAGPLPQSSPHSILRSSPKASFARLKGQLRANGSASPRAIGCGEHTVL